jgi:hypothetical protein
MSRHAPIERSVYSAKTPVWFVIAGWIAIAMPAMYVLWRILWAVGVPLGIEPSRMDELDLPGMGSITLVLLSLPALATAWFVWWFIVTGRETIPGSGGRRLARRWVVGILLIPILILAYANVVNLVVMMTDLAPSDDMDALTTWSLWTHIILFLLWWAALIFATAWFWHREGDEPR